ncbi:Npun_F0494 family protein [Spirulina subsalsa]|uniref:Npun_F0494 family protein n=1 Tax=Spirulina subsalsa TaxID=54311 RepID=UPI0002EFF182|nr:Npun_F0494 family protein [Spirulina subsalsa]
MTISAPKTNGKAGKIQYSQQTIQRAERALFCAPFLLVLWVTMRGQSVALGAIAGQTGVEQGYTRSPLLEITAESQLGWLIKVGVLRREVDGQGITDSFRLTPLGRQIVDHWQSQGAFPKPTLGQRLLNAIARWFTLSL